MAAFHVVVSYRIALAYHCGMSFEVQSAKHCSRMEAVAVMPRSVVILLAAAIIAPGQTPKKQAASSNAQMGAGILAIASDHQGTLFVDGEGKLDITPTKIVTLKLTAGQHFIDLRDAGGSKLWEKVVIIPAGAQVVERMEFGKPTPPVSAVNTTGL